MNLCGMLRTGSAHTDDDDDNIKTRANKCEHLTMFWGVVHKGYTWMTSFDPHEKLTL